jgi:hypothetical protein
MFLHAHYHSSDEGPFQHLEGGRGPPELAIYFWERVMRVGQECADQEAFAEADAEKEGAEEVERLAHHTQECAKECEEIAAELLEAMAESDRLEAAGGAWQESANIHKIASWERAKGHARDFLGEVLRKQEKTQKDLDQAKGELAKTIGQLEEEKRNKEKRHSTKHQTDARATSQLAIERKLAAGTPNKAQAEVQAPQWDPWQSAQGNQGSQARGSQDRPAQPPQQSQQWESRQTPRPTTGEGGSADDAVPFQTEALRALARTSIMEATTMRDRVAASKNYRDRVGREASFEDTPEADREKLTKQFEQGSKDHYNLAQEARNMDVKHQRKEKSLRETCESFLGQTAEEADTNKAALMQSLQDDEAAAQRAKSDWESEKAHAESAEAANQEEQAKARAARKATLLAKTREAHEAEALLDNLRAELSAEDPYLRAEIAAEEEAGRRAEASSQKRLRPAAPEQKAEAQRPAQAQAGAEATPAHTPGAHDYDPNALE